MTATDTRTDLAVPAGGPVSYENGVVPREGENGLYSQSWFPVARSEEVPTGAVIGKEFLGGRVAVFRGADGAAAVVSAFCPHMGADISGGDVVDGSVRCPFHFWRYETDGRCSRTGSGDAVPPDAKVFSYPTAERYGLIFAFNGETPLFDLPSFSVPEEDVHVYAITEYHIAGEGWEYMCNTFDFNHFIWVHKMRFDPVPWDDITWDEWGGSYHLDGTDADGMVLDLDLSIISSNFYREEGVYEGRKSLSMYACGLPRPGHHIGYEIIATTKGDGSPEQEAEIEAFGRMAVAWADKIILEDKPILEEMRFRPVRLTKSDAALGKYLNLLRHMPRAHPGADFI